MNTDLFKYAVKNIMMRKMRSFLSSLSIVIGVMAIFAIMSFGLGLSDYMNSIAEESGTDKLFIQAKGMGAPGVDDSFLITKDDIEFVSKIRGVSQITGLYMKPAQIKFDEDEKFAYLMGMNVDYIDLIDKTFTITVEEGRHLEEGEADKVLLGYNYQFENKFFKEAVELRDKVEISGKEFSVVGFYEEVGNAQDDSNIYLTFEGYERLFPGADFGFALVSAEENAEELAEKIEDKLAKEKGQEEGKETFYVQTFSDAIAIFQTIILVINGILFLIAFISVVVATVNILNTMYTSVIERTKEIGTMKAIGAKNSDIMQVFLIESGLLGTAGGAIGVLLGWIVASLVGYAAAKAGYSLLSPVFPWYLTLGCILFAGGVGMGAGILPSLQAAKQNVVDALRYE